MSYQKRRNALLQSLKEDALTTLLITEPKSRQYLSGFDGSAGWLLVHQDRHIILTDGRYWDQVERQCPEAELFRFVPAEHQTLSAAVAQILQGDCAKAESAGTTCSFAIETDGMTLSLFRCLTKALDEAGVEYTESEGRVTRLREIKDQEEVELLKTAAGIADRALAEALAIFAPGMRECDLKAEIEHAILRQGGSSTSFPTIVASGPNGSYPHAGASDRVVGENELITIDFGAVYRGYCSDMTRTIWYGTLPETAHNLIDHTRRAQELALSVVAPGITCQEVDATARDYLRKEELDQFFVHSLGHGVGLDIHESPGLRKSNSDPLCVGHVITIEPGLYVPGQTGCRVEDTVVVTPSGYEVLNRFPKQPLDAEAPLLALC